MIFLTLGTQLAFDRLVQAVDEIVPNISEPVFGQIGNSNYKPKNFEYVTALSPTDFTKKFSESRVIIAHAGIGTILSGQKAEKPLVLMARIAKFGEHRNDHQLATIEQIKRLDGVYIVENKDDIKNIVTRSRIEPMKNSRSNSLDSLINNIKKEIFKDDKNIINN
ncbi:glycosyltransferase [Novosphingobium aquimarinum]|uniref:glycosyltransferase n=1 Tax=Novosphingobium aquimarinum TaxID=2682494 RepID=UPI0012EB2872|nr:glycosyltransferase [Novosphingobium aquimarinum]